MSPAPAAVSIALSGYPDCELMKPCCVRICVSFT